MSYQRPVTLEVDRYRNLALAFRKRQQLEADNESLSMEGNDAFVQSEFGYASEDGTTKFTVDRMEDDYEDDESSSPYTLQIDDDDDNEMLPDTIAKNADPQQQQQQVYIIRQKWPWCSFLFSITQTIILAIMMWQCGMAPFRLNPMIGPFPDALSEWGGKNSVLILLDNQAWRLFTPTFLHAGIIHLVANLAIQLTKGAFMEKEWGSYRWLIVYLTSAVGSNVLSVIFLPQAVSVGSSGAVMGLFGGKLAEVVVHKLVDQHPSSTRDAVAQSVRKEQYESVTTSVIVILLFSVVPFVDWAAHFGGLISGFLIGIAVFGLDLKTHRCIKILVSWCGLVATVYVFFKTMQYMYQNTQDIPELRDVCGYYKKNFASYECNCMRSEMNQYQNSANNDDGNGGYEGGNYNGDNGYNYNQNEDQYNPNNYYDGGNAYDGNQNSGNGYNGEQYAQNNYYDYSGGNAANYNGGYDSYSGNNYVASNDDAPAEGTDDLN